MAPTISQLFFLLAILFPLYSTAHPSPFNFLTKFEGYHKGDKVEGLNDLKQYLNRFGYLNSNTVLDQNLQSDMDEKDINHFDDTLESAIKTYQLNYHLKPTGILDSQTLSNMMLPRCGVSDIINGFSRMQSGQQKMNHHRKSIHAVTHYQFFSGSPKWPVDKTNLTYKFEPNTPLNATQAIARAFNKWSDSTHFTFIHIRDNSSLSSSNVTADIRIGFYSRAHGDGFPFDGPFGVLGHASPPTSGSLHLDADEPWSIGPVPGHMDLETVALHEIGHLLGLQHSSVKDAIMYPSVSDGERKDLHGDDVQGIKDLYTTV